VTRKPISQGDEDGLCGLYSIINALALLFPVTMDQERRDAVFKEIALACPTGIKILFNGTTVRDMRYMLHAARNHLTRIAKFDWEQPFAKTEFTDFETFRRELKWRIEGDDAFGIVGLSKPWEHWTCAHRLTEHEMIMTDSCHVRQIALAKCGLTGDGTGYEFDYRQTFTLMRAVR
jgi:hypothetical protein